MDWTQVHGWFDPGDSVALDALLHRLPIGGIIVNVGTYCGRNLAAVAPTILERNLKVLAVDPWASTPQYYQDAGDWERTYTYFTDAMKEFGITANVTAMKMMSVEAAMTFRPRAGRPRTLDLVFIDAEHTYEAVLRDILVWKPLIKHGGIIAGHDYGHPLFPGVAAAVDELLPRACCLGDVESTVWWADV